MSARREWLAARRFDSSEQGPGEKAPARHESVRSHSRWRGNVPKPPYPLPSSVSCGRPGI